MYGTLDPYITQSVITKNISQTHFSVDTEFRNTLVSFDGLGYEFDSSKESRKST